MRVRVRRWVGWWEVGVEGLSPLAVRGRQACWPSAAAPATLPHPAQRTWTGKRKRRGSRTRCTRTSTAAPTSTAAASCGDAYSACHCSSAIGSSPSNSAPTSICGLQVGGLGPGGVQGGGRAGVGGWRAVRPPSQRHTPMHKKSVADRATGGQGSKQRQGLGHNSDAPAGRGGRSAPPLGPAAWRPRARR